MRAVRLIWLLAIAGMILVLPAGVLAAGYSATANLDDQALATANELQCPVCQNVTVAYSNSPLAAEMRQVIRDKLNQGQTHDQIIDYFVERYGEGILTDPPKHGLNLLGWLLPAAAVALGLGIIGSVLRGRSVAGERVTASSKDLDPAEERLLADALRDLD